MRRAPVVLTATAAGLGAVLGFHPHAQPVAGIAQAPAATAPTKNGGTVRQLTGTNVPNQYGDVQVRVTTSGGQVTQVTALQLPSGDGRSQEISNFAGPELAQQALAAQNANIDGVSGATYTSQSYRSSLQSALDQLPSPATAVASQ
ncbi:MAG TPA: FMN-binding protein [Thermoleophilaceae bacterium]|nr:FMN-binding protein [Thermoleophilaceae bacterium]